MLPSVYKIPEVSIPETALATLPRQLPKADELAAPVEVLPEMTMLYLAEAIDVARFTVISDNDDLVKASENANNLTKAVTSLETLVKELRRPLKERADAISAMAKPVLEAASAAEKAQLQRIQAYKNYVEEERQRIIAEEKAKAEKAEAERQAAIREKARLVEEARLKAEAAQREKERLEWEAQQREAAAVKSLDQAQGNAEAFEDAAKKFDEGLEVQAQADAAALAQADAVRLQQEMEALAIPVPAAAPVVAVLPSLPKARGTASRKVVDLLNVDIDKLPTPYRMADEAKIKRAIKDGLIDASQNWCTFRISEISIGSGR